MTGCDARPWGGSRLRGTELTSEATRSEPVLTDASDLEAAVAACDALGAALLSYRLGSSTHGNVLASPASLALNLATGLAPFEAVVNDPAPS